MKVGRNQPCPCGSGRKYKQCCESLDQEVGLVFRIAGDMPGAVTPAEVARAAGGEPWQADVIHGSGLRESVGGGSGVVGMAVVMGGGHVLCLEALDRAPGATDRTAALLERAVRMATRGAGVSPSALIVRSEDLAARLRASPSAAGFPVTAAAELPELDSFATGALEAMGDTGPEPPPSETHDTWRRWGWPTAVVAELFQASAAFWRAAPWRVLDNDQVLSVRAPSGSAWTACVLGNGGIEFGLALYRDLDDLLRQMETDDPAEGMAALREPVLSLTYVPRAELERATVKEILAAGWEVADREAYPELVALNPPPEGVPVDWAQELIGALWSVPRFVKLHRALLDSLLLPEEPVQWVDPASGLELGYDGPVGGGDEGLWEPPDTLASALPAGPAADPEAALATWDPDVLLARADPILERFHARLEQEGVAPAEAERSLEHVSWLIDGLAGGQGVPLAACTELDLRLVLYDWFPRKSGAPETEGPHILASLDRFFAHLAEREGLVYPWLASILADRQAFEIRLGSAPGGAWWDADVADWRAEVYDDLAERVLLPDSGLAGGGEWGATMGLVEAALHRELGRQWLLWRDEAIAGGLSEPVAVSERLVARQREWELAGHPGHEGRTPVEVIAREREAAAR